MNLCVFFLSQLALFTPSNYLYRPPTCLYWQYYSSYSKFDSHWRKADWGPKISAHVWHTFGGGFELKILRMRRFSLQFLGNQPEDCCTHRGFSESLQWKLLVVWCLKIECARWSFYIVFTWGVGRVLQNPITTADPLGYSDCPAPRLSSMGNYFSLLFSVH